MKKIYFVTAGLMAGLVIFTTLAVVLIF